MFQPALSLIARAFGGIFFLTLVLGFPGLSSADFPQIRLNTDSTGELQNEQSIAINPIDPDNIVACWRDFRLGYRQVGVAYTLDGGDSWTDFLMGGELPWDSDPSVAVDDDGTFYMSILNYENDSANQLSIHRSATGGTSWEGPWTASFSETFEVIEDKPWVAVDRSGGPFDGSVYVAWGRFFDRDIYIVRSDDRGETWTDPQRVSEEAGDGNMAFPLVLADGSILVAWGRFTDGWVAYDISTDGGVTWGVDRGLAGTSMLPGLVLNGGIASLSYPTMVVDESAGPRSGFVYCVYADQDEPNGVEIFCHRSTDNGATWNERIRVNDDPLGLERDQFHPWLTIDENGTLFTSWYDRRHDANNFEWHVYMSSSADGGSTWSPNVQVTNEVSSPAFLTFNEGGESSRSSQGGRARSAGSLGEYSGIAAHSGVAFPIWTDTRNEHQDTYTSRIDVATGIPETSSTTRHVSARAYPNPSRDGVTLELRISNATPDVSISIVDTRGRLIREFDLPELDSGLNQISWDGRDGVGRAVEAGVYHARISGLNPARLISTKVVLLR